MRTAGDVTPMTVEQIVVALLRIGDAGAVPEFTLDGEVYLNIVGIDRQADGNVTLEVEPW